LKEKTIFALSRGDTRRRGAHSGDHLLTYKLILSSKSFIYQQMHSISVL